MDAPDDTLAEQARLTRRVTSLSVATALVLVSAKAVVWLSSGSVALLASMADSGLDLVASAATFFAVRYAAEPPDAEHRYGHGKAEAFAGLLQAGLVFASAALIGQEAVRHLVRPQPIAHQSLALAVMAGSTVLTALLIAAQTRLLRTVDSVAVSSDRTHYAADLVSNLVALAGIGLAAVLGWNRLDALAGLVISALLLWGAIVVFRQAADQLMDHELPEEARAEIARLIAADPQLTGVHELRTRAAGPTVHIQAQADVDPGLPSAKAHELVVAAEQRLLERFPGADVLIRAHPRSAPGAAGDPPAAPARGRSATP